MSFARPAAAMFNERRHLQTKQWFASHKVTEASFWPFVFCVRPPQQMTADDPFYNEFFFFIPVLAFVPLQGAARELPSAAAVEHEEY